MEAALLDWVFLSNAVTEYGTENGRVLLSGAWKKNNDALESSLGLLKDSLGKLKFGFCVGSYENIEDYYSVSWTFGSLWSNWLMMDFVVSELGAGPEMAKNWKQPIEQLQMLGRLIRVSPEAAELFMAGTDFLDALIHGYEINIHPDLRTAIINVAYASLTGITEGKANYSQILIMLFQRFHNFLLLERRLMYIAKTPKYTHLIDQIYHLKTATESQKSKLDDSLAARLVTKTNLLRVIRQSMDKSGVLSSRANAAFSALEETTGFRPRNSKAVGHLSQIYV